MAKSKQSKRQKKSLSVLENHSDDESPESSPPSKESLVRRTRAAHRGAVTRLISKMDDLIPQADTSTAILQQIRCYHERLTEKLGMMIQLDEDILEYVDRVEEKLAEVKYLIQIPGSTIQHPPALQERSNCARSHFLYLMASTANGHHSGTRIVFAKLLIFISSNAKLSTNFLSINDTTRPRN